MRTASERETGVSSARRRPAENQRNQLSKLRALSQGRSAPARHDRTGADACRSRRAQLQERQRTPSIDRAKYRFCNDSKLPVVTAGHRSGQYTALTTTVPPSTHGDSRFDPQRNTAPRRCCRATSTASDVHARMKNG